MQVITWRGRGALCPVDRPKVVIRCHQADRIGLGIVSPADIPLIFGGA